MSPQPHERRADKGLSGSVLRVVEDPDRVDGMRQVLSRFNHRCRNSLNAIRMGLYLFKRELNGSAQGHCAELERSYQELERLFDRLQVIYHPMSLTPVRSPLGQFFNERLNSWRLAYGDRARGIELAAPEDDRCGDFDPMHLTLGLDAFVAWRINSGGASEKATLSWRVADDLFDVNWSELPLANRSRFRGKANGDHEGAHAIDPVDSLALPLLKRIIAAHGGSVETVDDCAFIANLKWPRFQPDNGTH